MTFILAAKLSRADLVTLVHRADAKVAEDENLNSNLGVIEVKEIKAILRNMMKEEWQVFALALFFLLMLFLGHSFSS